MSLAPRQVPSRIAREAAAWIVREHAGFSAGDAERLQVWLADPAHRRAWQAARDMWSDMDDMGALVRLGALDMPARDAAPPVEPRRIRAMQPFIWVAAVVCALILLLLSPTWLLAVRADARTGAGEVRVSRLEDGSTMTLDARSAVAIDFGRSRRRIRLFAGAAEFEVASDPLRPFVVEAAGAETTALGTVFAVENETDGVQVTDIEHRIAVRAINGGSSPVLLLPGQTIHYDARSGLGNVTQAAPSADAWRRGLLMFENEPLGEVVHKLDRYYSGHIVLVGAALSRFPVSGVFPTADPAADVTALERTLGIHTLRPIPGLIFVYR
ncbi:MAG TPA: FecR domain-containing protein [Steroidobacteraceae bacterium]